MKHSERQFKIQTPWNSEVTCPNIQDLAEEFEKEDPDELYNALAEIIDEVLDLKQGESMYFQPNRDDNKSKGIITRIK